jgi:general secretion pathway protein D
MKNVAIILVVVLTCGGAVTAFGQANLERKLNKSEYTNPQELVSIAPTTTFDKALSVISEVSKKFTGKILIDTDRRTSPINVDIQGLQWRDALETICRKNDIWYTEYENYIQIGSATTDSQGRPSSGQSGTSGGVTTTGGAVAGSTEIKKEVPTFRSREIKISAIFFEVNLTKLDEVGINWNFMKSTSSLDANLTFTGADQSKNTIFKTEITPKVSFANMSFLAKLFSSYQLGEILSGPQLVVRSGEEGRIQVGQDFSIRERDFAGNLIDKFYSAGSIVRVTPQVITEKGVNFIHMNVEVERSSVDPQAATTIVNKSKAQTNLLLLDGEESIIGGLYNTETNTIRSGVPFLKDLPWYIFGLRYLFGYNSESTTKKELVILLKAELVPTLQERITQKAKEDGLYERWREEQGKAAKHVTGKDQ